MSNSLSTVSTGSQRLKYVDYAKAFTIFLVILGHTNDAYVPEKSWLYLDFCYAFHMPLFFMLSGFFLHTKDRGRNMTLLECMRKDFLALIIPFFIWGCIYMQFSYYNWVQLAYGSWLKLRSIHTLTSLWFLPVLFLGKNYCNAIFLGSHKLKFNPTLIGCIALPLLFAAGFLLPHNNALDTNNIGNFWGYDIAFVAAGFVMTGALLRPFFDKLTGKSIWHSLLLFVISGLVFYFSFTQERPLLTAGIDNTMAMCNAGYGPIGYCLVNAFSGSFALIAFSIIIAKMIRDNSTLLYIGANTMGVYLIHKHIIFALKDIFSNYGFVPNELLSALCIAIPALIFTLLLLFLVQRFAPHLLGKNIPPEKRQSIRDMFDLVFVSSDSEKTDKQ